MNETTSKSAETITEAPKIPLLKRAVFTILGLFILASGVSAITVANLGTVTISTVPFVLNRLGAGTIGMLEMGLNILSLIVQLIILKGRMKPVVILIQLLLAVGVGVGIDVTMPLIQQLVLSGYLAHLILLLCGIVVTSLGISLMVQSQMMMPLDALVDLIAKLSGKSFGFVRTFFDVGLTVLACILSLVFLRTVVGIREGTVLCAFLLGLISNVFIRLLHPILKMA